MKKEKKLKVLCRVPSSADCGVGWYRAVMPLYEAEYQGLIDLRVKHFTYGEQQDPESGKQIPYPEEEAQADLAWCDVALFMRNDVPMYITWMAMSSDLFKKITLLDYDDLVWHTRPTNPGYRSFHPNSEYNQWNHEALKYLTGLTVSTQFIKNWYVDVIKSMVLKETNPDIKANLKKLLKSIYILPNSMDMRERDKVMKLDKEIYKPYDKSDNEFRIICSVSASHYENIQVALPAIKNLMRKYDNVTFMITGLFGDLFADSPDLISRVKTVPFVGLRDYGKMLRAMNGDIAIAPLTDCNFNRAKSNLRVLEYGSVQYPVIASDVEPYKVFTKEEVALVSPEEWEDKLEELYKSKEKRDSLAKNLNDRIKRDFDIKKNCKLWVKCFKDQVKKQTI